MAPPTPRLYASRATLAPAAAARTAVSSVDPSSTTSTSTSGISPRTSATTASMQADSLKAGMTTNVPRSPIISGRSCLGPQDGQFLGDRARLLLELTDFPAQVHTDQQQQDDAEEQHKAHPGGDPDRAGHTVQQAGEQGERDHDKT